MLVHKIFTTEPWHLNIITKTCTTNHGILGRWKRSERLRRPNVLKMPNSAHSPHFPNGACSRQLRGAGLLCRGYWFPDLFHFSQYRPLLF